MLILLFIWKKTRLTLSQRIRNWFYNTRIGKLRKDERPTVLNLAKGSKRTLQPYQAYLKLYNDKLKPTVDAIYQEKLLAMQKGDKPPDRFKILIHEAQAALSNESPAVKAEVEKYRLRDDDDDADDDKEAMRRR